MRYLVISDIHGALDPIKKIIEIFNESKCDKIICLGDILYHGPRNDLPSSYNPKEVIKILNSYKDNIISIKGNCDAYVDEMVLDFKLNDDFILNTNLKILLTHGHFINPSEPTKESVDLVLYGHTHIHQIEKINGIIYLNPGSISIPKGDGIASYGIMDEKKIQIFNLNKELIDSIIL